MIPLAPGPGILEPMSWAWLTGTPVLFIGFIGIVLGIPASVITIWLFRPVVRRATSTPAETPAVQPAPMVLMAPSRYHGGAVSTDGAFASYAPVVPITNPPNTMDLTRLAELARASEVITVSDSDSAFARD